MVERSNGRALALHARSTGIDTRILQVIFYHFLGSTIAREELSLIRKLRNVMGD